MNEDCTVRNSCLVDNGVHRRISSIDPSNGGVVSKKAVYVYMSVVYIGYE